MVQQSPQQPQQPQGTSANFALTTLVLAGMFTFILMALLSNRTVVERTPTQAAATLQPTPTVITSLPTPFRVEYTARKVSEGASLFQATCSACHGQAAQGVPGLGKNLIENEFVENLDDKELLDFIIVGRTAYDPANTTGITMPARGGNPAITDENLYSIIAYLRTAKDPTLIVADGDSETTSTLDEGGEIVIRPTEPWVYPLATPVGQPTSTPRPPREFDVASAYALSCSGCHGLDGNGVPGSLLRGGDLSQSMLVLTGNAQRVYDFIITGNPGADPAVDFPHPVRGEYPALTDEQLRELVDYVIQIVRQ